MSNGQNTVARLLTLATKNYLPYRVIRWRGITDVGIACGCDGTEGNKCVIVFGRSVVERPDVKPFKSSTANIGETCDIGARES